MHKKTVVKNSFINDITSEKMSAYELKRIKLALLDIDNVPITVLSEKGLVKKLKTNNLYMYRAGTTLRVVFGIENGCAIVYTAVNTKKGRRQNKSTNYGRKTI